jgi:iron complex outermembrane receptor protein
MGMKVSIAGALRRNLLITSTLGMAIAMPATAFAQQAGGEPLGQQAAPQDAPQPEQAQESRGGIQDIVVTARRSSERAQDVPIAITTITAQGLTDLSMRDVLEVQKVTPGLYMTSQNSAGRVKVAIRGQTEADSRLTTDPSVGIYIDGVNFLRDYGLRSSFVDIAQIEVLKGPQGTLFGKNTTGGAINITTQHPTYDAGGYVDLLYGSYNNVQALGVLNMPLIHDRLAMRVVGQIITREGFGEQANGMDIADDNVITGRALLRADPVENVSILLSADYVQQRNAGTNVVITHDAMLTGGNSATGALGQIAAELGLNPASSVDRRTAYNTWRTYYDQYVGGQFYGGHESAIRGLYDEVDHWGVSADVSVDIGAVTVRSITAYRHLTREYVQGLDGTPFNMLDVFLSTEQQNFSQEVQISSIDGSGLDWQVGAFYNREKGNEFSGNNTNLNVNRLRSNVNDTDSVNSSIAGYSQIVYNVTDTFRVTGGLRYTDDYREITSHNRIDPREGIALPPLPPSSVARCNLLSPAAGGPVFPNCNYTTGTHFDNVTWLVSADWRPIEQILLYASASKGYRSGGYTAQASNVVQPSQAALDAAFTPYAPEEVLAYEVGFKADILDRRLRINGAVFYSDYTNIQAQIRDVVNNTVVSLIRNAAKATPYGGELEITAQPGRYTTITGGVAYLKAKYDEFFARTTTGELLDLSSQPFPLPEWTFNIGLAHTVPLSDGELRFNANYNWVDDVIFRPDTPNLASVTQPAYGLLDARITWSIDSAGLDIAVFGKNLTKEKYLNAATNLQSQGYNIGFPGDPRVFGVQVRKTF